MLSLEKDVYMTLCDNFSTVIRADLASDSFELVKSTEDSVIAPIEIKTLSRWLSTYGLNRVQEYEVTSYLNAINIYSLLNYFSLNDKKIISYHCIIDDKSVKYRMRLTKSFDYSDETPIIFITTYPIENDIVDETNIAYPTLESLLSNNYPYVSLGVVAIKASVSDIKKMIPVGKEIYNYDYDYSIILFFDHTSTEFQMNCITLYKLFNTTEIGTYWTTENFSMDAVAEAVSRAAR